MKITRSLSKRRDPLGRAEIFLRLTIDRSRQHRLRSGVFVRPECWNGECIAAPRRCDASVRKEAAEQAVALARKEQRLFSLCVSTPAEKLTAEYVRASIEGETAVTCMDACMKAFLAGRELSASRRRQYLTLARMLTRYGHRCGCDMHAGSFDSERVADFMAFLRDEHLHDRSCRARGHNTVCSVVSRLRTLLRWMRTNGMCTAPDPFASLGKLGGEVYGTPFFLRAEELQRVAQAHLNGTSRLAELRDVFVFQCLVGCRVSDLLRLRPANIVDGALEYVACKTRRERPVVVRVPLHPVARAIVRRYNGADPSGRLLPFACARSYNKAIKSLLKACGVTRSVSVLDPVSQTECQHPLHEVAGSHLARRTFIGNLYRLAKDPRLVGAMSGHKDGSAAFARYRCIDDDIKRELIEQTFCRQFAATAYIVD